MSSNKLTLRFIIFQLDLKHLVVFTNQILPNQHIKLKINKFDGDKKKRNK